MTFRRDKLTVSQGEVICAISTLISLFLLFFISWKVCLPLALFFTYALLTVRKRFNQFITIDEHGVLCTECEKQLWAFEWQQIKDLKKYSRSGHPGISLVLSEEAERHKQNATAVSFQLSKEAKNALDQYYGAQWREK